MRTKSYQFTGVALNRPGSWVSTSCNKASASARTWRRQLLIARGSPCASTNGDLSRSDISMRAAAFAAQRSSAGVLPARFAHNAPDQRAINRPPRVPFADGHAKTHACSAITDCPGSRPGGTYRQHLPRGTNRLFTCRAQDCRILGGRLKPARRGKAIVVVTSGHLELNGSPHALPLNAHLNRRCLKLPGAAGPARRAAITARPPRDFMRTKTMRASALDLGGLISSFSGHHTLFVQPAIRRDPANRCQTSPAQVLRYGARPPLRRN